MISVDGVKISGPVRAILTFGLVAYLALALFAWLAPQSKLQLWSEDGKFPLYIIRNELSVLPMEWLWSLAGLREAPAPLIIAWISICLAWILAPDACYHLIAQVARRLKLPNWMDALSGRPLLVFAIAALLCGALMVNPQKNILMGDGFRLAESLRGTPIAQAEVATSALFWLMHWLLRASGISESMDTAIRVVSILCGGVYAVGVSFWANGLRKILGLDARALLLLFIGGLVSGASVMFFGYVETTQVVAALMTLLFGALAHFFAAIDERRRQVVFRYSVVITGIAVCAHTAAVSLFPALAVLVLLAKRQGLHRTGRTVFLLAVLPVILVLGPFYARGEFGSAAGGGDGIMFVPFAHVTPAWPRTDYLVYYSMLSWPHLIDIGNALLATSPLALFVLATTPFLRKTALPQQQSDLLKCGAAAAGGCASIVLLWNFDFGMWGDWNLCTAYLLPLHFFAWTVLAGWLASGRELSSRIAGIIFCQFLALLGVAYQLW